MWKHFLAIEISDHCTTVRHPFSVILSSQPVESLAGILAGFMMTSAAFILGRQKEIAESSDAGLTRRKASIPSQTLTLFGVGVLILGLDAYLYGMITGTAPPIDSHRNVLPEARYACAVAWAQYLPAGSMLAVGACFMIAGLGWMLAWHIGFHDVRSKAVAYVPGTITGIVVITTSLMMVRNADMYANAMSDFGKEVPQLWIWILWGLLALLVIWVLVISGLRTLGLLIRVEDSNRDLVDALSLRTRPLALATLGAAFLAIAGPALASLATDTNLLRESDTGVPTTFGIVVAITIGVLPGYAILAPLVLSVPGPSLKVSRREIKKWRRRRRAASGRPIETIRLAVDPDPSAMGSRDQPQTPLPLPLNSSDGAMPPGP